MTSLRLFALALICALALPAWAQSATLEKIRK